MVKEPIIIKNFFSTEQLFKLKIICDALKASPETELDDKLFHRLSVNDHPVFTQIHENFVTPRACELFREKLIPSYSFLALYLEGKGVCPLHYDRKECYRTVDVCLNHKEIWPIYINSELKVPAGQKIDDELKTVIKKGSRPYLLSPGDAICYSGTDHPHWREQIQPDNFCDLVFFHFMSAN